MRKKRELTAFGKLVKMRLLEKNMTLRELSAEVGTSGRYMDYIIHGRVSGKKYYDRIIEVLELDDLKRAN